MASEIGMRNLMTKGLGTRVLMIGTLTGLQWWIYDSFKVSAKFNASLSARVSVVQKHLYALKWVVHHVAIQYASFAFCRPLWVWGLQEAEALLDLFTSNGGNLCA